MKGNMGYCPIFKLTKFKAYPVNKDNDSDDDDENNERPKVQNEKIQDEQKPVLKY